MQPYVIRQGDHLAHLAHKFGFDPQAVWQDGSNDELREARPDPNILCPGDVLYIPDPVDASSCATPTGRSCLDRALRVALMCLSFVERF